MNVFPGGIFYQFLKPEDVHEIFRGAWILNGNPVGSPSSLLYHDPETRRGGAASPKDIPFFALQEARVMLKNRGRISAEHIEEYIGRKRLQGGA